MQSIRRLSTACSAGFLLILLLLGFAFSIMPISAQANLPPGFTEVKVADGLVDATAMKFAPDGRLFVLQKPGQVRVIKNGVLLATPFHTLPAADVDVISERGLINLVFDPNFASNGFLYLYYTQLPIAGETAPYNTASFNRLVRLRANPPSSDVSDGTVTEIFKFDALSNRYYHNSGTMEFGLDGKLYIGVGDDDQDPNRYPHFAQRLDINWFGKVLRMNIFETPVNGKYWSAPTDNPFYNAASPNAKQNLMWTIGHRNPYNFALQPGTGRLYAAEVGENTWEEINHIERGHNYGWPKFEGSTMIRPDGPGSSPFDPTPSPPPYTFPTLNPPHTPPVYEWQHDGTGTCAATAGAFYNPPLAVQQFPVQYVGKYFFVDYCAKWIKVFDPESETFYSDFATNTIFEVVELEVGPDGALYYLARGGTPAGQVWKITYPAGAQPPVFNTSPQDITVTVGDTAAFTCSASSVQPITYQWQRKVSGAGSFSNVPGATGLSYTTPPTQLSDDGAEFRCAASNNAGTTYSDAATLNVTSDYAPEATILSPTNYTFFNPGDTVTFLGQGTDVEDGDLLPENYHWEVVMIHQPANGATHAHPELTLNGVTGGSFDMPVEPHGDGTFYFRITLTVTDSDGRTGSTYIDVLTAPLLEAPANISLLPSTTIPFQWKPVANATFYDFQYGTNANLDTSAITRRIRSPLTATTLTNLTSGLPLYWRVRAVYANNSLSQWSDTWRVTPGTIVARNFFTTNQPTLTWNRVSWAVGYEVQIAYLFTFIDAQTYSIGDPNTLTQLANPLPNGVHYWRVRAKRADGSFGPWSAPEAFTVRLGI